MQLGKGAKLIRSLPVVALSSFPASWFTSFLCRFRISELCHTLVVWSGMLSHPVCQRLTYKPAWQFTSYDFFIHLFNKHLLNAYYVIGNVLGTQDVTVNPLTGVKEKQTIRMQCDDNILRMFYF